MAPASGPRSTWLTALALFLGLAFALGAAGYEQYFRTPFLETGDSAVNALQIDNAGHFRELYGNYSRWEFNHPGPAFFYVYAAGEAVFHRLLAVCPAPGNAHIFTSMLVQAFFFSGALAILGAHFRSRAWLPLALLAGAGWFGAIASAIAPTPGPFMSIWPPWVLLMPALCFLAACTSVAHGRSDHLVAATLAGGFLFHGHVAQPLYVGALGGLALGLWRWGERMLSWREFRQVHRTALLGSAGVALLFVLPLAIDVATLGTRSNVATILGRFYSNTNDDNGSKSVRESLEYFLTFATTTTEQEYLFAAPDPAQSEVASTESKPADFLASRSLTLGAWAAILIIPPLLGWLARRRLEPAERRFLALAYGFLAAAIGVCLLWGLAQAGLMYHFNGLFYYAVYYFGALLALGLIARGLDRLASPYAVSAACAITAVIFTWSFRLPRISSGNNGESVVAGVDAALAADASGRPKLLVFEHRDWPTVAGIALDLQRRGVPYFVNPYWEYMFGRNHDQTLLGADPEEKAAVWWITEARPGEREIRASDSKVPLFIHQEPAPIRPGDGEIVLLSGRNAFRHVVSGITVGNEEHASTVLPRLAFLFRPEPAEHDVRVIFDAAAAPGRNDTVTRQPGEIRFNGQAVGTVEAGPRSELEVTIPRELWNRDPRAKLEVLFPTATPVRALKRPRHEVWNAWDLWSVRFRSTNAK